MNNNHNQKERKSGVTATVLIRWAGLFAIMAGILYIVIQFIHPSDHISSVNSNLWVIVACLTMAMSLFSLIGITGIYMTQVEKVGWLGLVGYLMFSLFWLISIAFTFIEAFVLPMLTTDATSYVEGMLGIFDGTHSEVNLGVFPGLAMIAGVLYMLGGLLLGIATFRSGVLPRLASALLAFGAVLTLTTSVIPHPLDRMLAVPMGLALIWLGSVLWLDLKKAV
jgi:hypothetical protein